MLDHTTDIIIIGSSGFIGKHLLNGLLLNSDNSIRLLKHQRQVAANHQSPKIKIIEGDVLNSDSLSELITEGSIVINLVYLANLSSKENLKAILNISQACVIKKSKRLIHCSTAVICGRTEENVITEETISYPFNEYEKAKFEIENLLLKETQNSDLELIILRPTAVFGEFGQNLLLLVKNLRRGNRFFNYLKSCLYNKRTMNLVSVHNVTSALMYLIKYESSLKNQIFQISDDEDPNNNFRYIEKVLMKELGIADYKLPRIPCPPFMLSIILKIARKSNTNPYRVYSTVKLKKLGWSPIRSLSNEVMSFAIQMKKSV